MVGGCEKPRGRTKVCLLCLAWRSTRGSWYSQLVKVTLTYTYYIIYYTGLILLLA